MSDLSSIEPIHIEGVKDYHMHCDYSFDASGTIEEYCESALRRNLAEICFTTHYDNNPNSDGRDRFIRIDGELQPTSIDRLGRYVDDVHAAAEKYYVKGISVKLGVEFGWYRGCEEEALKLKEKYNFDYMLCGIHEIDNISFCSKSDFEKCFADLSLEAMLKKYFMQVKEASDIKLFDTIAHFCYYYKYARKYYGDAIEKAYEPYLDSVFTTLVKNGTELEINTSGIRHGIERYYPNIDIINKAKKAGVKIIHLGSDAHHPTQVGYEFEVAASMVPDTITGCEE